MEQKSHPGGNPGANLKSISHGRYLCEVVFVWELTEETINFPLCCLQGGGQDAEENKKNARRSECVFGCIYELKLTSTYAGKQRLRQMNT